MKRLNSANPMLCTKSQMRPNRNLRNKNVDGSRYGTSMRGFGATPLIRSNKETA